MFKSLGLFAIIMFLFLNAPAATACPIFNECRIDSNSPNRDYCNMICTGSTIPTLSSTTSTRTIGKLEFQYFTGRLPVDFFQTLKIVHFAFTQSRVSYLNADYFKDQDIASLFSIVNDPTVTNFNSSILQYMPNLLILQLQYISQFDIRDLLKLEELDLAYFQEHTLKLDEKNNLPNLNKFFAGSSLLRSISISGLSNLKMIILPDCRISAITRDTFSNLANLESLDLNRNAIVSFDLADMPNLKFLSLRENKLRAICCDVLAIYSFNNA
jgi:Leucine-rich repeat (LRR) protein